MRALVCEQPGSLKVCDVPVPVLEDGEALVRVKCVGLCGTDALIVDGLHPAKMPTIPGHEAVGLVEKLQGDCGGLAVGDRVYMRGSYGCGECPACRAGNHANCKNRKFLGGDVDGAMAEFIKVPANILYKLPDNVTFSEAQSITSIATVINLMDRMQPEPGKSAVVIGPGHNGLILVQALHNAGLEKVVMIGTGRKVSTDIAYELGADHVFSTRDPDLKKNIYEMIPGGPDYVIESSGVAAAFGQAIDIVRPDGKVMVFSIYGKNLDDVPIRLFYDKQMTVSGVKGTGNLYAEAIEMLAKGEVRIEPIITHRFSLEDSPAAFACRKDRSANAIRIIIEP